MLRKALFCFPFFSVVLNAKGISENIRPQARRLGRPGQRVNSEAIGHDGHWQRGGHNLYTVICCQSGEYL